MIKVELSDEVDDDDSGGPASWIFYTVGAIAVVLVAAIVLGIVGYRKLYGRGRKTNKSSADQSMEADQKNTAHQKPRCEIKPHLNFYHI